MMIVTVTIVTITMMMDTKASKTILWRIQRNGATTSFTFLNPIYVRSRCGYHSICHILRVFRSIITTSWPICSNSSRCIITRCQFHLEFLLIRFYFNYITRSRQALIIRSLLESKLKLSSFSAWLPSLPLKIGPVKESGGIQFCMNSVLNVTATSLSLVTSHCTWSG